jgi:hypothetical protein
MNTKDIRGYMIIFSLMINQFPILVIRKMDNPESENEDMDKINKMIKRLIGKLKTLRLYLVRCSVKRKKRKLKMEELLENTPMNIGSF